MGSVLSKVEEMGEDLDASLLMQAVGFLPSWGDKNFQVGRDGGVSASWVPRLQEWDWGC